MMYLLAGGVMIAGIIVYLFFMIFLPEWVGITGKTALNNQKSHAGPEADSGENERNGESDAKET